MGGQFDEYASLVECLGESEAPLRKVSPSLRGCDRTLRKQSSQKLMTRRTSSPMATRARCGTCVQRRNVNFGASTRPCFCSKHKPSPVPFRNLVALPDHGLLR